MAELNPVKITFEVDPIVKLVCSAFDCKHNLARNNFAGPHCDLKYIFMNTQHQCREYEKADDRNTDE
jgi:hypothetical protein